MNPKNNDKLLRQVKRLLLKSMDGRENQRPFMRSLMKENMFTSLLMKNDMSYLKESTAGTILMKKESNIMLALNQSENGLAKEPENLKQRWMNESLPFKKNSEELKKKK